MLSCWAHHGIFGSLQLLILINYWAFMSEYVGRRRGAEADEYWAFNKQASKDSGTCFINGVMAGGKGNVILTNAKSFPLKGRIISIGIQHTELEEGSEFLLQN